MLFECTSVYAYLKNRNYKINRICNFKLSFHFNLVPELRRFPDGRHPYVPISSVYSSSFKALIRSSLSLFLLPPAIFLYNCFLNKLFKTVFYEILQQKY